MSTKTELNEATHVNGQRVGSFRDAIRGVGRWLAKSST